GLDCAAVGEADPGGAEKADGVGNPAADQGEVGAAGSGGQDVEVQRAGGGGARGGAGAELPTALEQFLQAGVGDGLDEGSDEEAVGEGGQGLVIGEGVGGPHAEAEGASHAGVASAEDALVE